MSRPPVICLKKEEPRSRYVRREVLSVLQHYELSGPATSGSRLFLWPFAASLPAAAAIRLHFRDSGVGLSSRLSMHPVRSL